MLRLLVWRIISHSAVQGWDWVSPVVRENLTDMTSTQGTYEFMSNWAGGNSGSCLHSPIDDLESFYHTTRWAATLNNCANMAGT